MFRGLLSRTVAPQQEVRSKITFLGPHARNSDLVGQEWLCQRIPAAASFGHKYPRASPIQTGTDLIVRLATFFIFLMYKTLYLSN